MKRLLPVFVVALLLMGCFHKPAPTKNTYSLNISDIKGQTETNTPKKYSMIVGQISVASGFEGRSLVYKVGPNQFETDFYNELIAPPDRLLADLAVQYLDTHSTKMQVLKNSGLRLAEFGIEAYIEKLYGDYSQTPHKAVVNIKFTVNDLRPAEPKGLISKNYISEVPISGNSPALLVEGLSRALTQLLAELTADINALR